MRRLQHNAAASAVAVDRLQLVTAELAEEVEARVVHRAVAVFRRQFALGLLAHAQNRVEQKRERGEARDEQHSAGCALVYQPPCQRGARELSRSAATAALQLSSG